MTKCKDCEFPDLCMAFRDQRDHLNHNGYSELVGCDSERYIYEDDSTQKEEK